MKGERHRLSGTEPLVKKTNTMNNQVSNTCFGKPLVLQTDQICQILSKWQLLLMYN